MQTILINKYRPKSFRDVRGQPDAVAAIRLALKKRDVHAFVFSGPSGCGKTTLARLVADSLDCRDWYYREINAGNRNGVDDAREIASQAQVRPMDGGSNVFVIDEAHALTKQAWTCLLKVIEEPPPYTYFIFLTTEPPSKLWATVRNRCLVLTLRKLTKNEMSDYLEMIEDNEKTVLSDRTRRALIQFSGGSPRAMLTGFAAVRNLGDDDAEAALQSFSDDEMMPDAFRVVATALIKGQAGQWKSITDALTSLEPVMSPEAFRIRMVAYLLAVAKGANTPARARWLLHTVDCFSRVYVTSDGWAPVYVSVGQALFMRD